MKKALVALTLCLGLLFSSRQVFAADHNFTCTSSGCTPSTVTGFFPSSEVWYPGKTLVKTISVTNQSGEPLDVAVNAQNYTGSPGLDEVVQLTISRSGTTVWDGSLYSFYRSSPVELQDTLAHGASQTFTFTAFMYEDAGNQYQNKSTTFDMALNFTGGSSSSDCNAKEPNVPGPLSIDRANDHEVKLSWGAVGGDYTGYRVTWSKGTDTDGEGDGSKSVGKTTQTSIGGLELDKYGYYFKVRAVNDCRESQPNGIVFVGKGPDLRQGGAVLGASASSSSSSFRVLNAAPTGQVQGEATARNYFKQPGTMATEAQSGEVAGETTSCKCIWWQILLTELIVTLIYFWITRETDPRVHGLAVLFEIFGGFAFFRSVNTCLGFKYFVFADTASPWCRYFFFMNTAAVLLAFLIRKSIASKSNLPSE